MFTASIISQNSMAYEAANVIASAKRGDPEAQTKLGVQYLVGYGVVKNPEEGIKWLKKAAQQKHGGALFTLGKVYYEGLVVKRDVEQAINLYRASAQTGETASMVELGKIYAAWSDDGIVDFNESEEWYRKAVNLNNSKAMALLGWAIYAKNKSEAVDFFRRAASMGDADGMIAYGRMYQNGVVVPTSTIKAHMWFTLAEKNGGAGADTLVRLMESEMTVHEMEESRRYAANCLWKRYSNCGEEN